MCADKRVVDPREAVEAVRLGLSDEALMDKFSLSARGLDSLFRKLVKVGELSQAELDRRLVELHRSQSVILGSATEGEEKPKISVTDAVGDIKAGMSDLELMEKYSLSARGLDSLLKKLVNAGEFSRLELEKRMAESQSIHAIVLETAAPLNAKKRRIKSAEAVAAIRAGLSDPELMDKFSLSAKGLDSLLKKLLKAGEITQSELDARPSASAVTSAAGLEELLQTTFPDLGISSTQIVRQIRAGTSDAALMAKYNLSAEGLDGLFKKLVRVGELDQKELDERMKASQLTHFVELEEFPDNGLLGPRISASDAAQAIKSGMSDVALMARFNLSAVGLESLFHNLVENGEITRTELESRKSSFDWAELAYRPQAEYADPYRDDFELQPRPARSRFQRIWDQYQILVVAAGGVLAGMLVLAAVLSFVYGFGNLFSRSTGNTQPAGPASLREQADEVIAMLEDIRKDSGRYEEFRAQPDAAKLEDCLKECRRVYSSPDPADEGFLVNCRMQCVNQHGHRVRAMREQFYGKK